MVKILIEVDPLIAAAIETIGEARGWSRAAVIRSALYGLVWNEKRGAGDLVVNAPTCSPLIEGQRLRAVEGKLVAVDEWGLLI
jgi:hypothetical protein